MNVLSLFDGISCGQIALERSGITVDKYLSSEIDENAIKVTQTQYPHTIQLGDVGDVTSLKTHNLKIDLLMGGSPCQGFSTAGKRLNFNDKRSNLFFEFVRLLEEIKPKYFLLENVVMKRDVQDIITQYLGVEPILINSSLVSKQNRPRLYWTNIPFEPIQQPKPNCNFDGYLYRLSHGYIKDELKYFEKYPSLVAQSPGSKYRIVMDINRAQKALNMGDIDTLRKDKTVTRVATVNECEEFQTLPNDYTKILNKTQRYKVIGNGWTVDIVAQILKGIL